MNRRLGRQMAAFRRAAQVIRKALEAFSARCARAVRMPYAARTVHRDGDWRGAQVAAAMRHACARVARSSTRSTRALMHVRVSICLRDKKRAGEVGRVGSGEWRGAQLAIVHVNRLRKREWRGAQLAVHAISCARISASAPVLSFFLFPRVVGHLPRETLPAARSPPARESPP